jgi:hypothetical protein
MQPFRCPLCDGAGRGGPRADAENDMACKGCDGTGIVWGPFKDDQPFDPPGLFIDGNESA